MILIAERDQSVRALQRFFLERANFAVEFVDDGLALLERASTVRPEAVVTEILIPKLDGLTLCRRLHEAPLTRDVPVIIFSVLAASARAADAGAYAFLLKPLVESIFVGAIQAAIASHPAHTQE